jgi:hypothetical protein
MPAGLRVWVDDGVALLLTEQVPTEPKLET